MVQEEAPSKFEILKLLKHELLNHADFTLAFVSSVGGKLQSICCNQYGTIVITDSFIARGLTENDAKSHLSVVMLLANILAGVTCFGIGFVADKVSSYKILTINNIFVSCVDLAMIAQVNSGLENLGPLFDVGLVLGIGFHTINFMLSLTIISKLSNEQTRGSMFALNAVFGSMGILVI